MYINKTTLEGVPGFTAFGSVYWSSTESGMGAGTTASNNGAWLQDFYGGGQGTSLEDPTSDVRAVRAF